MTQSYLTGLRTPFIAVALLALPPLEAQASTAGINVTQLCNAVSDQLGALEPTARTKYQYQQIMRKAASVAETDPPEVVQAKMQRFWLQSRTDLKCNQLGFSVRDGNLVTLAFERDSREVINDFVRRWRLDLNFVDPATGKTPLDFVETEMTRLRGQSAESTYRTYRDVLVRNGAKRASEL